METLSVERSNLAELIWPTRCIGCNTPGELLCEDCLQALPRISQQWACPCCGAPFGWLTCTACKRDWLLPIICATSFDGISARIVTGLKDHHELRLAGVMAQLMASAFEEAQKLLRAGTLKDRSRMTAPYGRPHDRDAGKPPGASSPNLDLLPKADALAYVPATRMAYRRRGFDHMELVARELSTCLAIPLADVLVRARGKDQRKLSREQRAANLSESVEVVGEVSGAHFLLIDDVVTTGASMQTCAAALFERGASSVWGCAMARVW